MIKESTEMNDLLDDIEKAEAEYDSGGILTQDLLAMHGQSLIFYDESRFTASELIEEGYNLAKRAEKIKGKAYVGYATDMVWYLASNNLKVDIKKIREKLDKWIKEQPTPEECDKHCETCKCDK